MLAESTVVALAGGVAGIAATGRSSRSSRALSFELTVDSFAVGSGFAIAALGLV